MTEFRAWVGAGPKCFQVLGLSPSLLQNPMLSGCLHTTSQKQNFDDFNENYVESVMI